MFLFNESEPSSILHVTEKDEPRMIEPTHLTEISHFDRETTKNFLAVISRSIWYSEEPIYPQK